MNEMRNDNRAVMKKTFKTTVIVLTIIEIFAMGFFAIIFTVTGKDLNGKIGIDMTLLRNCILIAIPIIAVVVDVALYNSFKKKAALLSNVKPLECVIEDFLITSYLQNHKRHYRLIPIVKNPETGELLCTFGKYNMSVYSSVQRGNANSLRSASIVRSDGSAVEIGDSVLVYVKEYVNVNVHIEQDGTYSLNNKKHNFSHENQEYDVFVLNKLRFFGGMIDVDIFP